MTDSLQPYTEYKDSGQTWLGPVPRHWPVLPNRAIFDEVKDREHPDEEMLSVTITRGIVRQKALLADSSKKDSSNLNKSAYKLVQPRDIAYNKMRAWQGAIAASELRGIISPAYVVMRLREEVNLPRYFHHLYRTPLFAKEAERWSYGITSDMWSLRPEHFKVIYTPIPPADEQAAIVRFLDHANGRIERAIRAKRKIITLLNEQKQAIIASLVTGKCEVRRVKGEDGSDSSLFTPRPSHFMKPSGIPWLGDIPTHWEARHLRRVCKRIKTGGTPKGADERFFETGGFNWHTPSDFRDALELGDASRQLSSLGMKDVTVFPANTILMIGIGATIGKVSISRKPCSCNQQISAILPNTKLVHLDFLTFYLRTLRNLIVECGKFTTIPIINQDETKRLPVLIPPFLEQVEIAKHILQSAKPYTTAITNFEREIALLREYRTRLTADVVTGKLDVRTAAASLPDHEPVESVLSVPPDEPNAAEDPDLDPELEEVEA